MTSQEAWADKGPAHAVAAGIAEEPENDVQPSSWCYCVQHQRQMGTSGRAARCCDRVQLVE